MRPVDFGRAIKQALGDRTQAELAEALGISQPQVSDLVRGVRYPSIEQMVTIESATGRPPGFLLRAAGYLVELDTAAMIETDPALDDGGRVAVLGAYQAVARRDRRAGDRT